MSLRVLIVPDKFKGSLTAIDAALAIAAGWLKERPGDRVTILPMSDGGDGFGAVLGELMEAQPRFIRTIDAAHQPVRGIWRRVNVNAATTALIDSAEVIGPARLPHGKFHPFQLDSFGLGALVAAAKSGAASAIVGLGGSATNDAGFGMARALGWKFFNRDWDELEEWWRLADLAHARPPARSVPCKVTAAVDVTNPLLGPNGCSRVYGPQKGLRPQDFELAEKCLARLASVLKQQHDIDCANTPGAGAAGGLGFGLMAFAEARLESGFEVFARWARLDDRIARADLVITGEGQIDSQSYMGKGVGQVARLCLNLGIPCLAVAGIVLDAASARQCFVQARALTELADFAGAKLHARRNLRQLVGQMAKEF
ncbi:MAG: glycerate kinase [Verrucomicrobiota bacterium]